ncbi:MAG: FkbM family methyltransferase [Sulfitobacter sp.]
MLTNRFVEENFHIPKLKLIEIYPLVPFLLSHERMTCLDVGANIGLWCEAFLTTFGPKTERYYAFEPMSGNVQKFRDRMENHLADGDTAISLENMCVGADERTVEIHFDNLTTTLASVANRESDLGHKTVSLANSQEMQQVSIDTFAQEHGIDKIHMLKIDVEGYEKDVMDGCKKLFAEKRIQNVFFEFGTHQAVQGQTFQAFFEHLTTNGFSIYRSFRGKNYFGLNKINHYDPVFEPTEKTVDMYLATLSEPSDAYRGPRVVGQIN